MGVNAERLRVIVFAVSGATGALAGVVITPIVLASWDAGLTYSTKGFIGAILGGFRSPSIAVLGGLFIGAAGIARRRLRFLRLEGLHSLWRSAGLAADPGWRIPAWPRRCRSGRPVTGFLSRRKSPIAALLFVVAVVLYPLGFPDSYHLGVGITAGAMAVSTVGVVLLLGLAHQLAIGQAAFSMIGGYANAILCVRYGWDPFVAMLAGAIMAMPLAYVIAAPILKLRGFVLAMATLALHLMLIVVAVELAFTGGPMGVTGIPKFRVFGISLADDRMFFWFVWLLVFVAIWIGLNIDRSRIGRALRAIAASEQAAGSVGVDIIRHKVQMFVIGAGMASVSGSLLVHYLRATDPTVFSFGYSINLITGTIIGGLTSIWGGALGAAIIIFVRELLRDLALPLWESVIMGALTVIVLIVFPRGIAGFVSRIYDRIAGDHDPRRVVVTEPGAIALPPLSDPPLPEAPFLEVAGVSRASAACARSAM